MSLQSLTRKGIMELADSQEIFHRGEDYYRSKRITSFSATQKSISARVAGSYGNYRVKIKNDPDDDDLLDWSCSCPYDGDVCKHIVAVMLQYLNVKDKGEITEAAETPAALKQALTSMSQPELLELIFRLCEQEEGFRNTILANITIPAEIIRQQPRDARLVKRLKAEIDEYFESGQYRTGYDYYDDRQGDADDDALAQVFERARTLNAQDQVEIYWHIVTAGNNCIEEYSDLDSGTVEKAIRLYGKAVASLNLDHKQKRYHINTLIEACEWPMCDYADLIETIKSALDEIGSTPEDYRYIIKSLEVADMPLVDEWLASYYRKLGDEERYLKLRMNNLQTEEQYLDLARYWQSQGDTKKYIKTLEDWVGAVSKKRVGEDRWIIFAQAGAESIFSLLTEHYRKQGDYANLDRILMVTANYGHIDLELYKEIETVAKKLRKWTEHKAQLIERAKKFPELLAQIYLYEQDWPAAINLAKREKNLGVRALVADGIRSQHPQEAIRIYDGLVQDLIAQRGRDSYRRAADYAGEIKEIYQTLNAKKDWQGYLENIRKTNKRLTALQEEFRALD